jgi:hypothetical protein
MEADGSVRADARLAAKGTAVSAVGAALVAVGAGVVAFAAVRALRRRLDR